MLERHDLKVAILPSFTSCLIAGASILAAAAPGWAQSAMTPWVCWACNGASPSASAPIYASPIYASPVYSGSGSPSYYPSSVYPSGNQGVSIMPGVVVIPRDGSRGAIVNSTLINPTIVNAPIYNSTLINPTIVNSPGFRQYPLFDTTRPNPFGFPGQRY